MIKSKMIIFRSTEELFTKLEKIAVKNKKSVSSLIREAISDKFKIQNNTRTLKYIKNKRPGPKQKNEQWTQTEIIQLIKFYKPNVYGNKSEVANKIGRSYWAVKHKINELKINEIT
jgi:hypothetical protein